MECKLNIEFKCNKEKKAKRTFKKLKKAGELSISPLIVSLFFHLYRKDGSYESIIPNVVILILFVLIMFIFVCVIENGED